MSNDVNATHDPALRSWVASANIRDCDFPIQNLPLAVFRRKGSDESFRVGAAIGDQVLDLKTLRHEVFNGVSRSLLEACQEPALNRLMSMGREASCRLREHLSAALRAGSARGAQLAEDLVAQSSVEFSLPAVIGDYTDFYSSIHHATTVGRQFRPDNPLLPNYKWIPIAYHGRSSSIQVSGHTFPRPVGQRRAPGSEVPSLSPSQKLDFELEVGIFIGQGNRLGSAIPIKDAQTHVFGLCLLNDWSARDIQGWEYQPLGPFLSKNFASTISPWIVTLDALAPFRLPFTRPLADPQPLPYLTDAADRTSGGIDMALQVSLETQAMREQGRRLEMLAQSNLRYAYWTVAQMITHHTVTGCNLRPGDLLGSGTLSGPLETEAGSLLELTEGGKKSLQLASGETRVFLEDGDRVVMRAWCERAGYARIGFGESSATVLPARIGS